MKKNKINKKENVWIDRITYSMRINDSIKLGGDTLMRIALAVVFLLLSLFLNLKFVIVGYLIINCMIYLATLIDFIINYKRLMNTWKQN
jgi:hypothetical protein